MSSPWAHASVALMAKPIVPKAPLWALLAATQVPDLLFFALEAAGVERGAVTTQSFSQGIQYSSQSWTPWSHGFFMCLVWSITVAAIAFIFSRDRQTSIAMGFMVFIHWLLDAIMYSNLPLLFEGSPLVGFGLSNSGPGFIIGIIIEFVLTIGGIAAYISFRKKTRKATRSAAQRTDDH
jgi:hypothetical protein